LLKNLEENKGQLRGTVVLQHKVSCEFDHLTVAVSACKCWLGIMFTSKQKYYIVVWMILWLEDG